MKIKGNEEGFALVLALMFMVVLTIIGIAATTNTSLELQIAGNEKVHKKTFYAAEAGAVLSTEILEQNLNCVTGFVANVSPDAGLPSAADDQLRVYANATNGLAFWLNQAPSTGTTGGTCNVNPAHNVDISFPVANFASGIEKTDVYVGGHAQMLPGGSLQMAAGYERKGKSAAGGGVARYYDIISRHNGLVNSESVILFGWRHLVGSESTCNY